MKRSFSKIRALLPPKLVTIIDFEIGTYVSLWKCLAYRKTLKGKFLSKQAFRYDELQNGIIWMVLFLSIGEIIAFELLVSNEKIKVILLVLGIWSALLILGIWAAVKANPHEVDSEFLYVRQGSLYEILIPRNLIKEIMQITARDQSKCKLIDQSLFLPVMNETNIRISLVSSMPCDLPWGMSGEVETIYFYLDKVNENFKYIK